MAWLRQEPLPPWFDWLNLRAQLSSQPEGQGGNGCRPPLHIGNWANELPTRELLANSDLLVAVGTRFSYFPTGGWSMRLPERIIQIDMDPAEIGRNYRTEVGIVGDAQDGLLAIVAGLELLSYPASRRGTRKSPTFEPDRRRRRPSDRDRRPGSDESRASPLSPRLQTIRRLSLSGPARLGNRTNPGPGLSLPGLELSGSRPRPQSAPKSLVLTTSASRSWVTPAPCSPFRIS